MRIRKNKLRGLIGLTEEERILVERERQDWIFNSIMLALVFFFIWLSSGAFMVMMGNFAH